MARSASAFLALFLFCLINPAAAALEKADFTSGGKRIRMDLLLPAGAGQTPVILLVPGANGTGAGDGPGNYAAMAGSLQQRGFPVAVVHYLDRTGARSADAASQVRDLPVWYATLTDAVATLANDPRLKGRRIAVLGVSLGGTLGTTLAAFDDRISALVAWFGGFQPATERQVRRLPPTLILHGARDRIVPVEQARNLAAVAQRLGTRHELKIYADSGHGFVATDQADALNRVAEFLRK